ncbi:alpha/beta hydrolase [Bacteroidota bacterium]
MPWIKPEKKDDIHSYARKMAEIILAAENPIVIGVSLGGILASEMTTFIPNLRVIAISTIKGLEERPFLFKAGRTVAVQRLAPIWLAKKMSFFWRWGNRKIPRQDADMLIDMFIKQDNRFIKWVLIQTPKWKGAGDAERIHHIHGDKDRLFPIKRIANAQVVKDGTHMMVYTKGNEVSNLINEELKRMQGV